MHINISVKGYEMAKAFYHPLTVIQFHFTINKFCHANNLFIDVYFTEHVKE